MERKKYLIKKENEFRIIHKFCCYDYFTKEITINFLRKRYPNINSYYLVRTKDGIKIKSQATDEFHIGCYYILGESEIENLFNYINLKINNESLFNELHGWTEIDMEHESEKKVRMKFGIVEKVFSFDEENYCVLITNEGLKVGVHKDEETIGIVYYSSREEVEFLIEKLLTIVEFDFPRENNWIKY